MATSEDRTCVSSIPYPNKEISSMYKRTAHGNAVGGSFWSTRQVNRRAVTVSVLLAKYGASSDVRKICQIDACVNFVNHRVSLLNFLTRLSIPQRPAHSPVRDRAAFSLRLGHARVLTVHRTVIHYTRAASLP